MWHELIAWLRYSRDCRHSYASLLLVPKAVCILSPCPLSDISTQHFLESCDLSTHSTTDSSTEPLLETSSSTGYTYSWSFGSLITFQASVCLQSLAEIFEDRCRGWESWRKGKGAGYTPRHEKCIQKKKGQANKEFQLSSTHNKSHKSCNV